MNLKEIYKFSEDMNDYGPQGGMFKHLCDHTTNIFVFAKDRSFNEMRKCLFLQGAVGTNKQILYQYLTLRKYLKEMNTKIHNLFYHNDTVPFRMFIENYSKECYGDKKMNIRMQRILNVKLTKRQVYQI